MSNDASRGELDSTGPHARHAWSMGRGLIYFGAFVVVVAGLRSASTVLAPLLMATFFSIVCAPALRFLQKGIPFPAALSVVLLTLAALFASVPILIGGSLQRLITARPMIQNELTSFEASLAHKLEDWDLDASLTDLMPAFDPSMVTSQLYGLLNALARILGDGVVVLIMTGFMLTETAWFSEKLSVIDESETAQQRVYDILGRIRRYVTIKTILSIATGVCIWLGLLLLGIEYSIVWGFIAFFLNYVPTIGSIIAGAPPVVLALIEQGGGVALMVALLYLGVNQILGSIVEPRLQGRGLGLSPFVVFVSFLFWGWVFGPVGMLLSAPITMALKVTLEAFSETQWIAIMLGGKLQSKPSSEPV